ncbi:tagaturonate reductase [Cecembia calidifontis]|uniref:Tagaturonate reductase n=1 Tax=Cecembia calidifontis TaxID=1187080 RepID=A0A4Q7PD54_9BACT|nr:tagaturonate reductase [Cecembia calidifontis]RZS97668.1 tagaturonate reductase [Cecembia calidifontis]
MKKLNKKSIDKPVRPIKVLQFGTGNFLRGFADWMIEIMNEKTDFNGSVKIVLNQSQKVPEAFLSQDCLYHVIIQGFENGQLINKKKLITSIEGIVNPFESFDSFLRLAESPELKFIISNTTESGIIFDPSDLPDTGTIPRTFPGRLTAFLLRKYEHNNGNASNKLYIIPCELIEKNGEVLKSAILAYSELWKLPLGFNAWLKSSVVFCNSLVDRIVPGFPKEKISEIQKELDYEDNLIVMAEPFHLWVIEGKQELKDIFPAELAGLNVKFVQDIQPYRTRKVRILNGAHTAMVPLGYLKGFRTVKDCIEDKEFFNTIHTIIYKEIIPTLDLPETELTQFAEDVLDRFKNPFIRHELASIALHSVSKFKVRVLPSLLVYVEKFGALPTLLVESLSALLVFYRGEWQGKTLPVNDDQEIISFFREAWKDDDLVSFVQKVLANEKLWGKNLNHVEGLSDKVVLNIQSIFNAHNFPKA